jgi:hypothetical protein
MSDDDAKRALEAVQRAVASVRAGQPEPVACVYCGGMIQVAGSDTVYVTTCPCKKSAGKLTFARQGG